MYVITPDMAEEFIENLKIDKFYGVGKATASKMARLGIRNGSDLKKWTEAELVRNFGKTGHHYYRIARGIDLREVTPDRIRKSIGKEQIGRASCRERGEIAEVGGALKEK